MTDEQHTEQQHQDMQALTEQIKGLRFLVRGICYAFFVLAVAVTPWAFQMHANVASMRQRLDSLRVPPAWFQSDVEGNTAAIRDLTAAIKDLDRRVIATEKKGGD